MSPLAVLGYVWLVVSILASARFVVIALRESARRRAVRRALLLRLRRAELLASVEACWRLPAREPTRTQKW